MLKHRLLIAGALGLMAQMAGSEARADNWFDFSFLWPHRTRAYYADPYYAPARPRSNIYGNPDGSPFDENYYDPTLDGPRPVLRKPVKHKVVKAKAPAKASTSNTSAATAATSAKVSARPAQTVGEVDAPKPNAAGASDATATTKLAAASGAISCDKAQKVVAGYGFSDVKPATCSGKTYAFNATRDGKSYAIKLNAASGELTEVKKAQP